MGRGQGDVSFEAGGETYTLRFSANAICEIEAEGPESFMELTAAFDQNVKMIYVRRMIWGGLQDHHQGLTIRAAGVIIDELGLSEAIRLVFEAVNAAFGKPDENAKGGKSSGKKRGTGTGS